MDIYPLKDDYYRVRLSIWMRTSNKIPDDKYFNFDQFSDVKKFLIKVKNIISTI